MSSQDADTGSAEPPDPAASPAGKVSRSGRNLPMALAVGLGLGAVIIASLLIYRQTFMIIIVAAVVASIWELQHTLRTARNIQISWIPVALGAAATVVLAWPYGHTAQALGIAQGATDYALEYARSRETMGRPIAEHQLIAAKLADMETQTEAARGLLYRALGADIAHDITGGLAPATGAGGR